MLIRQSLRWLTTATVTAIALVSPSFALAADPKAAAPDAQLGKDVAAIVVQAGAGEGAPFARSVFLGWTSNNAAIFRVTICDADALGGRGPYCELNVCSAPASTGAQPAELACRNVVSTTLSDKDKIVAADILKSVASTVASHAPLVSGKPLAKSAVKFRFTQAAVTLKVPTRKKSVVIFTGSTDDGDRPEGVRSVNLAAVSQSPDGLCVATVGIANRYSHYEGYGGIVPMPFGVVLCRAATK